MKKYILALLAFTLNITIYGQANKFGIPFIKNYAPKDYDGAAQNWAAIQDKRGVMYFGNNDDGVLEFDGNSWRKIDIPNKSIVRSFAIDEKGTIYVGAVGEIGYLTPDKSGKLYYQSLLPLIDSTAAKFEDIFKTYYYGKSVYFCSVKEIIQYTPPKKIKVIKLSKNSYLSYLIDNTIYISNYNEGLKELDKDSSELSINGSTFAKTDIMTIMPYADDNLLLFVKPDESKMQAGIYIYNKASGELKNFKEINFSSFLNENLIQGFLYQAIKPYNNDYTFATIAKGCYVSDKTGNIKYHFNTQAGLRDETTIYAYDNSNKDNSQPLWLTLNNGIAKVESNSPLCRFGEESGLSGIAMDIIRFKGILYVATNTGVFYLEFDENQTPHFKQIKDIDGSYSFLNFKLSNGEEKLLVGSQTKICEIKKNIILPTDNEWHYCFKLVSSKNKSSAVYIGMQNGFKIINYDNNKWIGIDKNKEINDEIRWVTEDNDGNIWMATYINGIFKIDKSLKILKYNEKNGLPTNLKNIKIYNFNKRLYFITNQGLYKYEKSTDSFIADSSLGRSFADGSKGIFCMAQDSKGTIWLNLYDYIKNTAWTEHLIPKGENSYTVDSLPFKRFSDKLSMNAIYPDPDNQGVVWFATPDGIYSYNENIKRSYAQPYNTLIRKVIIAEDSVIFNGTYYKTIDSINKEMTLTQPDELKPILNYKNNKLSFTFAAPFFEEESLIEYSHYLEGFEDGWSKWSLESKAPYTNLPEGTYKFYVKAKNIYGIEGTEAVYEFEILPPWYRTIWAFISYAIIAILIVWLIVIIATRRMKQLNIAYGRYLPGAFLKLLEKRRVIDFKLGDMVEKEMTIMFSDIRSYTNLSETMTPFENFRFQVRYLSMIGIELNKNHGFPVQYYGDGIVAMFPDNPDAAVAASIDMHKRIEQYSKDRKMKGRRDIKIGIGMHTGKIIMGIRGDKWRWEGGIVGDSVNLASRIEGMTKIYGTSTLISDDTYNKLQNKEKFNIRFLGRAKVKGKDIPVGIYEILDGLNQDDFQLKLSTKKDFDNALAIYLNKDFEKALSIFKEIININSNDFTAHHYIDLCKLYIKEGIAEDWDGVEKLDKK